MSHISFGQSILSDTSIGQTINIDSDYVSNARWSSDHHSSNCIILGSNNELPEVSNNLVIVGHNIKLTTENRLENAIYVGGGDEMKVFFQNGNKFVDMVDIMKKLSDLEEKVTQLMYAPPGEGGPLYNDAKRSFDKHAKKLKRSQTDTRERSNSL